MSKRSVGITSAGYRRVWLDGRLVMEHRLVWEAAHGPIPDGFVIHHINEVRLDNRLENLQCLDQQTHHRIHSGCVQRDGAWYKPCSICGEMKPITDEHWYFVQRRGWGRYPTGTHCRPCWSARACAQRSARRAKRRTPLQQSRTDTAQSAWAARADGVAWRTVAQIIDWKGSIEGLALLAKRERAAGRA